MIEGLALGDFQSGPEAVAGAGDFLVGGAGDDVPREGIVLEHVVEDGSEFFLRDTPSDEGSMSEFGGEEGLAHTANDACFEHGANALEDDREFDAGLFGNDFEGVALKTGNEVFGNSENFGVNGVVVLGGYHVMGGF